MTLTFFVSYAIQTVLKILKDSKSFLTSTLFSLPVPILSKIALLLTIDLMIKAMNSFFNKIRKLNEELNLDDLLKQKK